MLSQLPFLSALDQLQKHPIPECLKFPSLDPLGEGHAQWTSVGGCAGDSKEDGSNGGQASLPLCSGLVAQAQALCYPDECLVALHRVTSAQQTLLARRVIMLVLCALSTYPHDEFLANLGMLKVDNPSFLIGLLRLVHAGRIDSTPGGQFSIKLRSSLLPVVGVDCLCAAIKTISASVSTDNHSSPQATAGLQSSGSHRFVQACCRDLVAAAVGGAEALMTEGRCGRSLRKMAEVTDASVLSCPNFSVSQSLVQGMVDATAASMWTGSVEVLCLADALAACILSSKLQREHRLWALKLVLRLLSIAEKEDDVDGEGMCMWWRRV